MYTICIQLLKGKNPSNIWIIPTQSSPEKHYAMYPEKLIQRMILCFTKAGDIVLNPFCGSATTIGRTSGFDPDNNDFATPKINTGSIPAP